MIDPTVLKIADDRIHLELDGDRTRISREIEAVLVRAAARGMGGNVVGETARICAKAAEERADLAWRIMYRTVTSANVGYSDALESDLKTAVAAHLQVDGLKAEVSEIARRVGSTNPQMVAGVTSDVDTAANRGLRRTFNEIELFVASLKTPASAAAPSVGHTINVYAPVGAIQTGAGANASIVQNFDAETKIRLDQALERLEREVHAAREEIAQGTEIAELVKDVRAEIAKHEPNKSKLRSLLSTTGNAVRTVGSLQPAYQAVKAAFAAIGIDLP